MVLAIQAIAVVITMVATITTQVYPVVLAAMVIMAVVLADLVTQDVVTLAVAVAVAAHTDIMYQILYI
jgi:hypothetical protein